MLEESNGVHIHTERSFVWGSGLVPGLGLGEEQVCEACHHTRTHTHMPTLTHAHTETLSGEDCGLHRVDSVDRGLCFCSVAFTVNRCLFKHTSRTTAESYNPV